VVTDFANNELAVFFAISFVAGILNAISGGGGMVLVPAMVAFGIPPINAITINKFQNSVGAFAAIRHYGATGFLNFREIQRLLPAAIVGAVLGAVGLGALAQAGILTTILPYVLLAVALYSVLPDRFIRGSWRGFRQLSALGMSAIWGLLGVYGGAVSLGTGPILIAAHRLVHDSELNSAITKTKPIMLAINMTSMSVLILMGHFWWQIAIFLAISNVLGALTGARMVTWSLGWLARIIVFVVPVFLALKLMGALNFLEVQGYFSWIDA